MDASVVHRELFLRISQKYSVYFLHTLMKSSKLVIQTTQICIRRMDIKNLDVLMEQTEMFHTSHHGGLNVERVNLQRYTRIHLCIIVIKIKYSFSDIHRINIYMRSAAGETRFETPMSIEKQQPRTLMSLFRGCLLLPASQPAVDLIQYLTYKTEDN